ncbi:MAG: hypothetical protein RLZZ461_424 [Planctomycetota bacterium]|jgi:hypothetical protein
MSGFGMPSEISALQSVQAQRDAATTRNRTRAALERRRSETEDEERFRVADVADISVVRKLEDESEGEDERSRRRRERDHADLKRRDGGDGVDEGGHIDLTA